MQNLGERLTAEEVEAMIEEADTDRDGPGELRRVCQDHGRLCWRRRVVAVAAAVAPTKIKANPGAATGSGGPCRSKEGTAV
uniref:EF-hand domain-containing protein n=1 Tax=Macrostomum lignano TaxID=282301 RepID=A0A1I8JRF9_9PLAT